MSYPPSVEEVQRWLAAYKRGVAFHQDGQRPGGFFYRTNSGDSLLLLDGLYGLLAEIERLRELQEPTECSNGPDEDGNWPCDPQVTLDGGWAECRVCGRVGALASPKEQGGEGLPEDLERILRDPSIIIPQDAAVFELIAAWKDAPTGTAAPLTAEEWERAWSVTVKRLLASEGRAEQAEQQLGELREELAQWRDPVVLDFLDASVAVWEEIDRLGALPGGYRGLPQSDELRIREAAAWEALKERRDALRADQAE